MLSKEIMLWATEVWGDFADMFSCVNLDNVQIHKFELDLLMHHILCSTTSISNAIYSNISTQPLNVFSYWERRLDLYDIRNSVVLLLNV